MPGPNNAARRRHARAVALATLCALLLAIMGGVAGAKGPESATITGPAIEEPVELIRTDNSAQVERLLEETGIWYGDSLLPRIEPPAVLGPAYTLTWIAGPPGASLEERMIRQSIYLDAAGGPVIHTPPQAALEHWGDVVGWGRASTELREALLAFELPIPPIASPAAARETTTQYRGTADSRSGLPNSLWYLAAVVGAAGVGLAWAARHPRPAAHR